VLLLQHRAHHGPDFAGDWAWTAPAGARQPGEPVLPAALRELAEEAGIVGAAITPVDVGAGWALFTAVVPAGTEVTMHDAEHDAYAWLPVDAAAARITPTAIADGLRRAAGTPVHDIAFRPLAEADLPLVGGWLRAPHVIRWWHDPPADEAEIAEKYLPRIEGGVVHVDVLEVAGVPAGFVQSYPLDDDRNTTRRPAAGPAWSASTTSSAWRRSPASGSGRRRSGVHAKGCPEPLAGDPPRGGRPGGGEHRLAPGLREGRFPAGRAPAQRRRPLRPRRRPHVRVGCLTHRRRSQVDLLASPPTPGGGRGP